MWVILDSNQWPLLCKRSALANWANHPNWKISNFQFLISKQIKITKFSNVLKKLIHLNIKICLKIVNWKLKIILVCPKGDSNPYAD